MSVDFTNASPAFKKQWTIRDFGLNKKVIFEGILDQDETISLEVFKADIGSGEVDYKHEGESIPTHRALLSDGDEVRM